MGMISKLGWLALGSLAALATAVVTGVFDARDWWKPTPPAPAAAPVVPAVQVVERAPTPPEPVEIAPVPIEVVEPARAPARPSRAEPAVEAPPVAEDPQLADLDRRLETLAKAPDDNSALVAALQRFSALAHRIEPSAEATAYQRCVSSAARAAGGDAVARLQECRERLRRAVGR